MNLFLELNYILVHGSESMCWKNKKIISILLISISLLMLSTVVVFASDSEATIDPSVPVQVTGGEITGTLSSDKSVAIYKGIPYAAPPVGNLRWKEPQPVIPWSGVKKCTDFSANAMQTKGEPTYCWTQEFCPDSTKGYSEDCLYLNVWTKKESLNKKRPVIVFIHGGSFNSGGSSCEVCDGEAMAKSDVVYVSINYRVGIFGFLVHPKLSAESSDGISGNYGIMDMIEALKWIKDNISQFGGDPGNVTIAGQSVGAAAVDLLAVVPKAKGLFQNVVSMSFGSVYMKMQTLRDREEENADKFEGMTLKEMRAIPADELLLYSNNNWPCIDGINIPYFPTESYYYGTANDVNMMSGLVMGDSGDYGFGDCTKLTKQQFTNSVKNNFGNMANDILKLYQANNKNALSKYNELRSDFMMATQYSLEYMRTRHFKKQTYIYLFNHTMPGEKEYGAFHSSDLAYWFSNFTSLRKNYWKKEDYSIGTMMSSYLVNFAKTGNPNCSDTPKWAAYDKNKITYHYIGDTTKDVTLSSKKSDFWKKYFGCE